MNIKKTILSALLMMGFVSVSAQEQPKTEYVFNPTGMYRHRLVVNTLWVRLVSATCFLPMPR